MDGMTWAIPPLPTRHPACFQDWHCGAGQRLAADHPERLPAHRAVLARGHLVRRRRWAVHLRRCTNLGQRGLLVEAEMTRLVRLRGYLNDLWLFSRQAGSEVENAHRRAGYLTSAVC